MPACVVQTVGTHNRCANSTEHNYCTVFRQFLEGRSCNASLYLFPIPSRPISSEQYTIHLGTSRPRFCSSHKKEGMVGLKNRPCTFPGWVCHLLDYTNAIFCGYFFFCRQRCALLNISQRRVLPLVALLVLHRVYYAILAVPRAAWQLRQV